MQRTFNGAIRSILIALGLAVTLSACATDDGAPFLIQDFAGYGSNYKKVDVFRLTPGDTKSQVQSKIAAKHEVIRQTEVNGYRLETWMYERWEARVGPDVYLGKYFVHFVDGEFVDWNNNGDVNFIYARLERREPGGGSKSAKREKAGTGTGFAITPDGFILTNEHVAGNCRTIHVHQNGRKFRANLIGKDPNADLALLQSDLRFATPIDLSVDPVPPLGADLTVMGYPLSGLVSGSLTVTTGVVSARTGLNNDASRFQLSAPINPGNSGGPVIDRKGRVIGIVVSKLNVIAAAAYTGDVAQAVNFGVKSSVARIFVGSQGIAVRNPDEEDASAYSTEQIVNRFKDSVVPITCEN